MAAPLLASGQKRQSGYQGEIRYASHMPLGIAALICLLVFDSLMLWVASASAPASLSRLLLF